MIKGGFNWEFIKSMSLGQSYGYMVDECVIWGFCGLGGQGGAHRCGKHKCCLMHTNTPVMKDYICCWIYIINISKRHWLMYISFWLGTPYICMVIAPPERIEGVLAPSWMKLSMYVPTLATSFLRTAMMSEALVEWSL